MCIMRLIIFNIAIIVGCQASGIGHVVPAIRSHPVVRYAPFYNFPGIVRSIHAVAPGVAPAPILPASVPAAVFPAPLPLSTLPAPVFSAPAITHGLPGPAPFLPTHSVHPASVHPISPEFRSAFGPPIAPAYAPALSPAFTHAAAPVNQYFSPVLPKLAPAVHAFPTPLFARPLSTLPGPPFAPILRPIPSVLPGVATGYPAPLFAPAPAPIAVAKPFPYNISPYAPLAPILKQTAWK